MAFKDVPTELLMAWVASQITDDRDKPASYLSVIKMTDAEKSASLTTFLNARIAFNSAQISGLADQTQAETDALNADTDSTNAALTTLNS